MRVLVSWLCTRQQPRFIPFDFNNTNVHEIEPVKLLDGVILYESSYQASFVNPKLDLYGE